jgi:polyisoprenyl-teichoic acid--peptidoglycan teichoic acid transferase
MFDEQLLNELLSRPPMRGRGKNARGRELRAIPLVATASLKANEQLLNEFLSRPPTRGRGRSAWRRPLRMALLVALAAAGLVGAFVVGRTAVALITIRQNIQAMRLPTAAPRPTQQALATPWATDAPTSQPTQRALATPQATDAPAPRSTSTPAPAASPLASAIAPSPRPAPSPTLTPVPQQLPPIGDPAPAPGSRQGQPAAALAPPAAGQPATVLLLGVDRRPDESGPSRSDAIVVLRIDPVRQRVAMLSLPRDLIVDIPGYGHARINAASVYGELYPEEFGGGAELERKTVSNLLGIPIDYVVYADFNGFVGAIDALGGIDVDVEKELYDPEYPTMDYGYMEVHFLPGPMHMDGATALIYSRVRHMDTTWDRARRQQQVLMAVLQRIRRQNQIERIQSVAALTTALRDYVQTDMPLDRMVGLAWALRDMAPEAVGHYNLDGSMVAENVDAGDPYAEYALPGAIESLTQKLMGGPAN